MEDRENGLDARSLSPCCRSASAESTIEKSSESETEVMEPENDLCEAVAAAAGAKLLTIFCHDVLCFPDCSAGVGLVIGLELVKAGNAARLGIKVFPKLLEPPILLSNILLADGFGS
jgi:hypothetical protein